MIERETTGEGANGATWFVIGLSVGLLAGILVATGTPRWLEEKNPSMALSDRYAVSHAWIDDTRCALFRIPRADGTGQTIAHCADGRYGTTDGTYGGAFKLYPQREN